jgi:hypothetical protein
MTDTFLSVKTEGLQEAIDNAREFNFTELMDALAEGLVSFKDRLRGDGQPPGNPWPIGMIKGYGPDKRYVRQGTSGGRGSGRSLKGWKSRQRGISAVVFNDARDKIGGTFYAQHVRLKGDDPGQAAKDAFKIFEEEMSKVVDEMTASLAGGLGGG